MMFSSAELHRYSRQLALPDFGMAGQQRLKAAKVLVIGAGGLGSPLLLYLAAAGVGTIGIVDADVVDESNLQRQVLYDTADIGTPKALAAQRRLAALNPHIRTVAYPVAFTTANALALCADYDLVADGTDNFPTRYLASDACEILGKPYAYASIYRTEGQVSVFHAPPAYVSYRDLFPVPPAPHLVPNCAEGGVLGVLAGIVGSLQANEVIKLAAGMGTTLSGRLFIFDALDCTSHTLRLQRQPNRAPVTQLIDYEVFCGINFLPKSNIFPMKEITVTELKALQDGSEPFQLIDVREPYEYDIANLGGELIPLGSLFDHTDRIARDKKVVVHCRSGARSANAILALQQHFGLDNLYNLKGGILAYSNQIDPSLAKY